METQKNHLIVIGSAPNVLLDIAAAPRICSYDFMAIGLDAVGKYPWPISYVATFHPAEIDKIRRRREQIGGNLNYQVISHERRDDVDIFIGPWWKAIGTSAGQSGSSSLLGVQAALAMGYRRIVCCGCPLTGKNAENGDYEVFRESWESHVNDMGGRVRSMSGWTAEILGHPTDEWLLSEEAVDER